MKSREQIQKMCIAALLCAIGILVPVISPVKIPIGPMSFTLASHVAIFIALFISPAIALTVCVGTTLGFLLAAFPLVVVLRAASQVVFVMLGAWLLAKKPALCKGAVNTFLFGLALGAVHAAGEMLVVLGFYFGGMEMQGGVMTMLFGFVGLGTLVHSMVDYYISLLIWKPVSRFVPVRASLTYHKQHAAP